MEELDEEEVIEVENVSPSKQIDRFHKRLEVYRTHQNDCKSRVEQTLGELIEQQNSEISALKSKILEEKPKRVNKKASRKPLDLDRDIQRHRQFLPAASKLPLVTIDFSAASQKFHQNFVSPPYSLPPPQPPPSNPLTEFDDLDFSGMANLLGQITQPLGPEVLFDESLLPQVPLSEAIASASNQHAAVGDELRQFYCGHGFGHAFMP